ncbi:MAG: protein-glutamate O-methyltransferase CheR [Blastocatellia bacterium]|nr:protein-glutamate O-methyltransferase CheR [Blastocatellia bacterium]
MSGDRIDALRAALARSREGATGPRLDAETFLGLRDLIADASGIDFDENSRYIVERRLLPRLRALRLDDFASYYRSLLFGEDAEAELERLLEAVTIRETYFCRERAQLEALRDNVIPEVALKNAESRRVRIWSAGCASGEEPYSVAMHVASRPEVAGWDVQIVGTDLVASAVEAARAGMYRDGALRAVTDEQRARYFTCDAPNAWRLDETVRRSVSVERRNLLDGPPQGSEPFDVILCRNVLLYFGEAARRRAVEVFHDSMLAGGWLLLGHAESLLSMRTPFRPVHLGRDLVYRR